MGRQELMSQMISGPNARPEPAGMEESRRNKTHNNRPALAEALRHTLSMYRKSGKHQPAWLQLAQWRNGTSDDRLEDHG
jgi:hypothetical protein